ncbi:MAG TPA: NUDIX domain-containing protein [Pseudonocardiaceae bacterium]|jgi:8-oxo-dGTP pyrophosphatase MutT (NUDIX family)|nr:NUDIX domain-containing protein [Pseudonocardiaceae bacterium]
MAARYPVSIKGVLLREDRVLLLRNERGEWELPGGRIELDETPEDCLTREIAEETGWRVRVGPILDSWLYRIAIPDADVRVFIVTYGCHLLSAEPPVLSEEHTEIGLFEAAEVPTLNLPAGYQHSVARWFTRRENGIFGR